MENKCKRFLSLLLAFVMVLGMFPAGHAHVHAEENATVSYVVDETPTAPEAGMTYVICFQKADGSYHAVTSTYAANYVDSSHGVNYIGTLDVNEFNGTYTTEIGWKLVQEGDKFYLTAADDGNPMTLQGTNKYDAFADGKAGELMTLTATEDGGYTIMNPSGRYLAALSSTHAGTAALENLIAAGNYTEPMTLYFFHVTEKKEVNLNVDDSFSFDVPFDYSDLNTEELGNGVVTVEADTTFEYEVNNKPVTELRSGKQYVIYNWRAKNNLTATGKAPIVSNVPKTKSGETKPGLAMVHENSNDVAYEQTMWTFTQVSGNTYTIQDCDGKYLTLVNSVDNEVTLNADTACNLTVEYIANASAQDGGYWRIGTGNAWLNPHGGIGTERAASYSAADAKTDEGSRWVIYEAHVVEDGERYAIVNNRAGQTLNSNPKDASDKNGQITGLTLYGSIEALTPNAVWTIDAIEGSDGYSFMNGGKYMTFADRGASTVAEPVKLKIERNGSNLVIQGTDGGYLNDFGAQGICAAGWLSDPTTTAKEDAGSQWKFHRITSEEATTHFTVTAVQPGTTTFTIGDVTYAITVNEVHVHNWVDATCIAPETCTSCNETRGAVNPDNHVNTVNVPGTPPTMENDGTAASVYCNDCQNTVSGGETIAKLLAAAQLKDNTVVSLENCEYTFTAENKLVHGSIYVGLADDSIDSSGKTPGTANGETVAVSKIVGDRVRLKVGGRWLHFFNAKTNAAEILWDRCSGDNHTAQEHDLYLFKADENASADSLIPGYTKVTSLEKDGKYLIVAKNNNGSYYVMVPSLSTTATDHIALLLTTHVHVYDWDVTTDAGCTSNGVKTGTCLCGDTKTEAIPAAHGTITHVDPKAATCTEAGNVEHWRCETCGKTWADETRTQEIEVVTTPVAHGTITHVAPKAATCDEPGNVEHWRCETCKKTWSDEACTQEIEVVTIPAAHQIIHVDAKAETCTETGNIEYWYCADCGQRWLNEACTQPTTVEATTIAIDPTAHNWGDWRTVIAADCTVYGAKERICAHNNKHVDTAAIPLDGNLHNWGRWQTVTAATCTTKGSEKRVCQSNAEHFETRDTAIDANNHTYGTLIAAQPEVHTQTELKAPVAAHYLCACGKYFTENKVETTLAALTGETPVHTPGTPVEENRQEPTLNSTGSYDLVTYCSGCNKEMSRETETIPALTGAVAEVGGTKYATLAEAVAVGGTVKLLADVTLTERLDVDKGVSLKLNGHTISGDFEDAFGMIYVKKGGLLTLSDNDGGSIIANKTHAIGNYGYVSVEGVNIVTKADETYAGLYNFYYQADYYGTAGIFGGSVDSVFNCGVLTVSGGKVTYLDNSGLLDVRDSEINEIYARDGSDAPDVVGAGEIFIDEITNITVPEGFKLVEVDADHYQVVAKTYVAKIGETQYETLQAAFDAVQKGDIIELLEDIELDTYLTVDNPGKYYLNLCGHNITRVGGTAIYVNNDETTLSIEALYGGKVTGEQAIFAAAGTVEIYRGTFHGTGDAIYAYGTGHIEIYGGTFSAEGPAGTQNAYCVLNVHDGSRATASISVHCDYKPTFIGFNPADNLSEGAGTNFLANPHYYCSRENNGNWTVVGGHVEVFDEAKDPTCTETGLTEGIHCSACGLILVAQESVPATGHTWGDWTVTKPATLNEKGEERRDCANCDAFETQEIPMLTGAAATVNGTKYATFEEAYKAAKSGDTIVMLQTGIIDGSYSMFYSKKVTIKAEGLDTALRIQNDAYVMISGMTVESDGYCIIVGASDGSSGADVDIMGGTYKGATSAISVTKGDVIIMDGTFSVEPYEGSYEYTINCIDANYKNGTAYVAIKGGKFYNFNPMNNASEGAGTNYLTSNSFSVQDAEGYWSIVELPTAEKIVSSDKYEVTGYGYESATITVTGEVPCVKNGQGIVSNWIGFKITKPAGVDANVAKVYTPGSNGTYNEKTLASILDTGKDYASMWVSIQYKRAFDYKIDWNADGKIDLVIYIQAEEATIKHSYEAVVTDPTFEADGYTTYTCSCGDSYKVIDEGTKKVAVATADGVKFETLQAAITAGGEVVLLENITLDTYLTVTGTVTLNLNGKNITRDGKTAIYVNGGTLTIKGEGTVTGEQAVWANAGKVVIESGTYYGTGDAIYTTGTGIIEIKGGTFSAAATDHTGNTYAVLNQKDNARDTSSIVVYGGSFKGFNPANNYSEGAGTNFVADGYISTADGEGNYVVTEAKTVTWYNEDGTVLFKLVVPATETVEADRYVGETPTKPETATHTYTFDKWVNCEGGYKATFTATEKVTKVMVYAIEGVYDAEAALRFYVRIPTNIDVNDVKIVLNKDGRFGNVIKEFTAAGDAENGIGKLTYHAATGCYVAMMGVASGEMRRGITLTAFVGGEQTELVTYSGSEVADNAYTSNLVTYATIVINGEDYTPEQKAAAKALLIYGGYAQLKFNVDADDPAFNALAEADIPDLSKITEDDVADYTTSQSASVTGLKVVSTEAVLDSAMSLRVYFELDEGASLDNYSFEVTYPQNGMEYTRALEVQYHKTYKLHYVEIPNIASGYVDYNYKLKVTNKETGEVNIVTTSMLAWVRSTLIHIKDEKQINLAKALYLYNQAANALFGK